VHTPANAAADTTCAASSTATLPSLTTRVTARAASPVLAAHDEVAPRQAVEVCIQPAQLSTRNMCTEFSGRSLLVASMNALMPPTESSDKKGQDDLESENLPLKQYLCVCVCARPCASHPRTLPYINSQILANRYIIVPLLLQPSASSSTIARLPPSLSRALFCEPRSFSSTSSSLSSPDASAVPVPTTLAARKTRPSWHARARGIVRWLQ